MHLFPAIDLLGGRAVRLLRGDYEQVTVYHEQPAQLARSFQDAGASWLHVVDLDGARAGAPVNTDTILEIARNCPGLRIEVGGGLRAPDDIAALLEGGVTRAILGSRLATDFDFVSAAVERFGPEALVAGVDARAGRVATQGWTEQAALAAADLVARLADLGLRHLVYTDIARDGARTGIDAALYTRVSEQAGFPVIVSGGVATLDDLRAARSLGSACVEGVIVGRALYERAFTLPEALAVLEGGNEDKGAGQSEGASEDAGAPDAG